MTELLVSYPEELLLAREATGELPETALVVPALPRELVSYFRAVVMDGEVHEHAVVLGASDLSPELRVHVADVLGRRKPTHVVYAEALAPRRYELSGDALGPRDACLVAAVACAFAEEGPDIEVRAGGRTFRVSAALERLFFRCRAESSFTAART